MKKLFLSLILISSLFSSYQAHAVPSSAISTELAGLAIAIGGLYNISGGVQDLLSEVDYEPLDTLQTVQYRKMVHYFHGVLKTACGLTSTVVALLLMKYIYPELVQKAPLTTPQ